MLAWIGSIALLPIVLPNTASNASRVLVLENTASPASVQIAQLYVRARKITHVLQLTTQDSSTDPGKETMSYANFQAQIALPVRSYLKAHPTIDFIVLTKGFPIRLIQAPTGQGGSTPSLDSTLASIDYADRKDTSLVTLNDSGFTGKAWLNRFWNSKDHFTHEKFGGYLVTRLDGYTMEDAENLIFNALASEKKPPTGQILLDTAPSHGLADLKDQPKSLVTHNPKGGDSFGELNYNEYDADMVVAGELLAKKGLPVKVDRTDTFIGRVDDLMGYCSWGSNDPHFDAKGYLLIWFAPGGIAETAVSTSARTFLPTNGGQSLIADLIHSHVTGVKGYCDEPLLQAIGSPTILFDRYTSGWTLAESFYAASRLTGWEDIVIGDPICTPYKK